MGRMRSGCGGQVMGLGQERLHRRGGVSAVLRGTRMWCEPGSAGGMRFQADAASSTGS